MGQEKMIPGKTKIAEFPATNENGEIVPFSIYYGNIVTPPVNGKFKTVKSAKYRELLNKFLESDEGLNYAAPTEEEIKSAEILMLNQRQKFTRSQEEAKKKEEEERIKKELESIDKMPSDMFSDDDEEDDSYESNIDPYDAPQKSTASSGLPLFAYIIIIILLIANLAAGSFNALLSYTAMQRTQNKQINLTIGERTYEVPSSEIPDEGDSTVVLYGIITTNTNGEVKRTAVPLGEVDLKAEGGNANE